MTVISAAIGWARAWAVISGPMPRGSPSVTANRGPLLWVVLAVPSALPAFIISGPDLDVRRLSQPVEVPPDRQLLPELLPYSIADVFVLHLALGAAADHLQHDELVAPARAGYGEDRQ